MKKIPNLLRFLNKIDLLVVIFLFVLFGLYYRFLGHALDDAKQLYVNIFTEIIGIYVSVRFINGTIEKNNKKDRFRNYFVRELEKIHSYVKQINPYPDLFRHDEMRKKIDEHNKKFHLNKKYFSEDESEQIIGVFILLDGLMEIIKSRIQMREKMEKCKVNWTTIIHSIDQIRTQKIKLLKNKITNGSSFEEIKSETEEFTFYLSKSELISWNIFTEQLQSNPRPPTLRLPTNIEGGQFYYPLFPQNIQSYTTSQSYEFGEDFQIILEQEIADIKNNEYMHPDVKNGKIEAIRNLQNDIPVRQIFIGKLRQFTDLFSSLSTNIFEETEKVN